MKYTSELTAEVYQHVGSDRAICDTARVSTLGEAAEDAEIDQLKDAGLIRYLMRNKHGSPFEHGSITFRVHAPIFVFWDHVRHRAGVSYNIESSRYRELSPTFYLAEQPRVQQGKPGAYTMTEGSDLQHEAMISANHAAATTAWHEYQDQLAVGIAREQAMQVLPMSTMISAYITFNPRSLMKFLELRNEHARLEMQTLAGMYRELSALYWPHTLNEFLQIGVAP